ncbi:RagB/SusD family nutrient uptake outer membrane protein [Chitinophaga silvatica]|uniref:RagB/SusD family nutrient uptake outer membrane protein n=1 Tax=Chitinophaga silvatica TaxID=2282649 RepID=A0A3E1Y7J7_9BACT|nr:RagB/SusD family nutrient uptake outer membrane protein [Chitinophaga silvatica]RFS21071.1 RagB/SusD family nutrient uptake outer membrane protein [Chitinophaga silvatica]
MTIRYIKNSLILATLFLSGIFVSCNKQLDLSPIDQIDPSKAFRNVADLNGGLLGAYAGLKNNTIYNVSLITDECTRPTENNTGGGIATYRWQIHPSNTTVTSSFDENYIAIDRVNRVLSAINKVKVKADEEELRKQYHGELLALRAYCHLELLRSYAETYEPQAMGIAYMDSSYIGKPSRNSVAEVISFIERDLIAAKKLIPASFDDNSRITLTAVSAIQARAALYAKKWNDAITYATEAIDAIPLATSAQFPEIWKDNSQAEVIWKLKQVAGDDLIGNLYTNSGDVVLYAPSFELINLFDKTNDVRYKSYINDDPRAPGKSQYRVNKYKGTTQANLADIKLFRTGEMYLIRAEAMAEATGVSAGTNDLNELRAIRINGYTNQTFVDKAALILAIYDERFKELAFEGHRMFDLRRRNLPVTRNPEDAINASGAVLMNPGDKGYAFPIPDWETKANKNMKQNPAYLK